MSMNYLPMQVVKVADESAILPTGSIFAAEMGGSLVNERTWTSNSTSQSAISWNNVQPPDVDTILDLCVMVSIPVRLIITGTISTSSSLYSPLTSPLNSGKFGPAAWPINGSCLPITAFINGMQITQDQSDLIHPLMHFGVNNGSLSRHYSTTPCMTDQSANLGSLYGTNRNPLAPYSTGMEGGVIHRGAFPNIIVPGIGGGNAPVTPTTGGTPYTVAVDYIFCEPLLKLLPFVTEKGVKGMINVQTLNLTLNFIANAGYRMLKFIPLLSSSGADVVMNNVLSIQASFSNFNPAFGYSQSTPQLLTRYITRSVLSKQMITVNTPINYEYANHIGYQTAVGGNITYAGGPVLCQSNAYVWTNIPRRIYAFVRPSTQSLNTNASLSDTYLTIENARIAWKNNPSLISEASKRQLFETTIRNGGDFDWPGFSGEQISTGLLFGQTGFSTYGGTGSVMCWQVNKDLQLDPNEAVSLLGQYAFSISLLVKNQDSSLSLDAVPMTLWVIAEYEGVFCVVSSSQAQINLSVLSKNDVLQAERMPGINEATLDIQTSMRGGRRKGGDFFSSLKDIASGVNNFLKDTKLVSTVGNALGSVGVPYASAIGNVAHQFGYGHHGAGVLEGSARHHGHHARPRGGCDMDQNSLRNALTQRR